MATPRRSFVCRYRSQAASLVITDTNLERLVDHTLGDASFDGDVVDYWDATDLTMVKLDRKPLEDQWMARARERERQPPTQQWDVVIDAGDGFTCIDSHHDTFAAARAAVDLIPLTLKPRVLSSAPHER